MDKRKGFLNVITSICSRILIFFIAIIVRRLLIEYIGNDVNGLNSLYTSIIGFLAVAELGIGSAIVFSMYKPIVEGNVVQVAALYSLYKKLYRIIGIVIFTAGLIVIPFLPMLINDYGTLSVNVYSTFFLTVLSVTLSYFYSAKTSLIEAHKNNYITTCITTISNLIRYGLQAVVILIWRSYSTFLFCQIIGTIFAWFLTEIAVRRLYHEIIKIKTEVDQETKHEISKNVKAMVMHKIGTVLVHTVDSIIISSSIGVVVLGKYSNYTYVCSAMVGIMSLVFSPLTSVVGHLIAEGNREEDKKWFDRFYSVNFGLGVVFFFGYFAVIDNVVRLLFGPNLGVAWSIVFIITVNQFTQYMRNTGLLFRNASGTFYNDRWKPVAEGVLNLFLSLLFVQIFPEDLKVVGVIVATIITTLTICYIVEPYVVFHHVFGQSPKEFYIRNYIYTLVFIFGLLCVNILKMEVAGMAAGIMLNGTMSLCASIAVLSLVAVFDKTFRLEIWTTGKNIIGVIRKAGYTK